MGFFVHQLECRVKIALSVDIKYHTKLKIYYGKISFKFIILYTQWCFISFLFTFIMYHVSFIILTLYMLNIFSFLFQVQVSIFFKIRV